MHTSKASLYYMRSQEYAFIWVRCEKISNIFTRHVNQFKERNFFSISLSLFTDYYFIYIFLSLTHSLDKGMKTSFMFVHIIILHENKEFFVTLQERKKAVNCDQMNMNCCFRVVSSNASSENKLLYAHMREVTKE